MTVLYLYRLTVNPPQVAKEALANMREPSSSQDYSIYYGTCPSAFRYSTNIKK